jgi:hypothetical protein
MARPTQPQTCCSSKCRREILPNESAVAISIFARTVGMGKQRTSKSQRMFLCPQCCTRNATGPSPSPHDPVELAFFKTLLDLIGSGREVMEATYEQLQERRQEILYPPDLPQLVEGEVLPPSRRLKEAS